jgi:hypothetical protein
LLAHPGAQVVSRVRVWEGYHFTALAALTVVERCVRGLAPPGNQTASSAYGSEFLTQITDHVYSKPPLVFEDEKVGAK